MNLKDHYDKLLHISITFLLMCFLCVWLPWWMATLIMANLQAGKVVWNYRQDYWYHWMGDMTANVIGYAIFALYVWVGGI